MSNHSYYYGRQQQLPQSDPPPTQSLTPYAQLPYRSGHNNAGPGLGDYVAMNTSYSQHNASIPGLGMGTPIPSLPYRPESQSPWHANPRTAQQNVPFPVQTKDIPPTPMSKQSESGRGGFVKPVGADTSPQTHSEPALEEGELSEGEFDDLYEPIQSPPGTVPTRPSPQPSSIIGNGNGSAGDADGSSIYDTETPQGEAINSTSTSVPGLPVDEDGEREGSYSPHLTPEPEPEHTQKEVKVPTAQHSSKPLPGSIMAPQQKPPSEAPRSDEHTVKPSHHLNDPAARPPLTVPEAKKKAQEAVLALMPYKVKYQDYLDEGIDERIVRSLFVDLGLEASIPKRNPPPKAPADDPKVSSAPVSGTPISGPKSQGPKDHHPTSLEVKKPAATVSAASINTNGEAKKPGKTAAEERKDKIARKLAAKAQKPVVLAQPKPPTPVQPAPVVEKKATSAASPTKKTPTRAEKNAILQQKLAARLATLKKVDEEKAVAEKLAAESSAKSAIPSTVPSSNPVTILGPNNHSESSTSSTVIASAAVPELGQHSSKERDGGTPSLPSTTQPSQPNNRNLKRPVAADFDNYPTPGGTIKRLRTQEKETLIINVSDDEDVEMDIASPTDELNSSSGIINSQPRHNSLGAFPPLSDSSNRKQPPSPVSTPPVPGVKLSVLQKRLEVMRRQLHEAEAKQAARKAELRPSAAESARLLSEISQVRDETRNEIGERRSRIVSYELPSVEANLKKKQDRLKQVLAEAASLERDIQATMEERSKLSGELDKLSPSPQPVSAGLGQQVQPDLSGEAATALGSNHAVESLPSGHRLSPEPALDVSMADDDDVAAHDQSATFIELRPDLDPLVPSSLASDEPHGVAIQPPQDIDQANKESRVGSDDKIMSESTDAEVVFETNEIHPDPMTDISDVQVKKLDHTQASSPRQLPLGESFSGNDRPNILEPVTAPPSGDIAFPGLEGSATRPLPFHKQTNYLTGEQPTHQFLNQISLPHSTQVMTTSAAENPTGNLQKGSSYEQPLLTNEQDEPEQTSQPGDVLSYRSPLAYFRAFRFHPRYFDEVAGGLKSMTYSSRIDPMRPVCPFELSGEQCPNGNACEYQHFETMVLPDAEIITQLGSADMYTGETRTRFIEGLKKVLNELKANKVKDFDRITKAIVKHRQEFLEDKSKVLPLDAGTS
ncbi:hypothetical protein GGR54DRAFT_602989 [Hypoxylon sp. NC1633]|nr:hypothetical protein GGR54DRAFT_602989 [Hypoxylon sp. NC1633]